MGNSSTNTSVTGLLSNHFSLTVVETYIKVLWTGKSPRILLDAIEEKVSRPLEEYPDQAERHFADQEEILDREQPDYRDCCTTSELAVSAE